jgi:hypothetical protein
MTNRMGGGATSQLYVHVYSSHPVSLHARALTMVAKRKGAPHTVYFADFQFARLEELSASRLVSKSDLLRVALNELLRS